MIDAALDGLPRNPAKYLIVHGKFNWPQAAIDQSGSWVGFAWSLFGGVVAELWHDEIPWVGAKVKPLPIPEAQLNTSTDVRICWDMTSNRNMDYPFMVPTGDYGGNAVTVLSDDWSTANLDYFAFYPGGWNSQSTDSVSDYTCDMTNLQWNLSFIGFSNDPDAFPLH